MNTKTETVIEISYRYLVYQPEPYITHSGRKRFAGLLIRFVGRYPNHAHLECGSSVMLVPPRLRAPCGHSLVVHSIDKWPAQNGARALKYITFADMIQETVAPNKYMAEDMAMDQMEFIRGYLIGYMVDTLGIYPQYMDPLAIDLGNDF